MIEVWRGKKAQPHPNIAYAVCSNLVAVIAGIGVLGIVHEVVRRLVPDQMRVDD
jgi:hypothetical protein